MYHIFLIHSSAEGHFGCFQVLAITNNAAINIAEQINTDPEAGRHTFNLDLIWIMPSACSLYKNTEEGSFYSLTVCSCPYRQSITSLELEPTSRFQHIRNTS